MEIEVLDVNIKSQVEFVIAEFTITGPVDVRDNFVSNLVNLFDPNELTVGNEGGRDDVFRIEFVICDDAKADFVRSKILGIFCSPDFIGFKVPEQPIF